MRSDDLLVGLPIAEAEVPTQSEIAAPDGSTLAPPVFHISQWKAGSQWVQNVFRHAVPERFIEPSVDFSHGHFDQPVRRGMVYSPLYIHHERFNSTPAAAMDHRKFVVIRDLRDILVSWHKSLLKSHETNDIIEVHRQKLAGMTVEEGLLYLMSHRHFYGLAMVALSWTRSNEWVVRYEDLVAEEQGMFRRIFEHCGIELPPERLEEAVRMCSFETVTGRKRGQEAAGSHQRRGVAGDWRNHFTKAVTHEFKIRFGHLLVVTGYEKNGAW